MPHANGLELTRSERQLISRIHRRQQLRWLIYGVQILLMVFGAWLLTYTAAHVTWLGDSLLRRNEATRWLLSTDQVDATVKLVTTGTEKQLFRTVGALQVHILLLSVVGVMLFATWCLSTGLISLLNAQVIFKLRAIIEKLLHLNGAHEHEKS